jgi:predicted MPP superfamily phosphohydrolase
MEFQLASDLHLESWGGINAPRAAYPEARADVLVLAGDTYNAVAPDFKEIVRRIAEPFRLVLFVPGNHEYYGSPVAMSTIETQMREACNSLDHVLYFNQASLRLGTTQFVGATMWTNPPKRAWPIGEEQLSDYRFICKQFAQPITPKETSDLHDTQVAWLRRALSRAKHERAKRAVVITHHAPDEGLACNTSTKPANLYPYYFATDMSAAVNDPFVHTWCYGHTHESFCIKSTPAGPTFCTNAHGYQFENTGYARGAVVKIHP